MREFGFEEDRLKKSRGWQESFRYIYLILPGGGFLGDLI